GVVVGSWFEGDLAFAFGEELENEFGELDDGGFFGVADVDGLGEVGLHDGGQAADGVGDEAEGAGLGAIAGDGDGVVLEGLADEIGDDAAVGGVHARAVGVEDSDDAGVGATFAVVGHGAGFGEAFGFFVHGAQADGVDVAPEIFALDVF